jgi:hypothetical protein
MILLAISTKLETVEHDNPNLPAVIEEVAAATITKKPKVVVKVMYIISAPHTKKPNIFSNHSTSAKEATANSSGIRNFAADCRPQDRRLQGCSVPFNSVQISA